MRPLKADEPSNTGQPPKSGAGRLGALICRRRPQEAATSRRKLHAPKPIQNPPHQNLSSSESAFAKFAEGVGFEPTVRLTPHNGFQDLTLNSPDLRRCHSRVQSRHAFGTAGLVRAELPAVRANCRRPARSSGPSEPARRARGWSSLCPAIRAIGATDQHPVLPVTARSASGGRGAQIADSARLAMSSADGLGDISADSGGLRLPRAGPSRTCIKTRSGNRMTRPGEAVVMPACICASW